MWRKICAFICIFMFSSCVLAVGRPDYAPSIYVCETCFLFLRKLVRVFLNLFDWYQGSIVCVAVWTSVLFHSHITKLTEINQNFPHRLIGLA